MYLYFFISEEMGGIFQIVSTIVTIYIFGYMRVNQDVKPPFEHRATDAVIVNIKSGELYTINKWVSVQPLTTNEVIKNGKET